MTKTNSQSIKCPRCQTVSHNPNDAAYKYCGHCHLYHDAMPESIFTDEANKKLFKLRKNTNTDHIPQWGDHEIMRWPAPNNGAFIFHHQFYNVRIAECEQNGRGVLRFW